MKKEKYYTPDIEEFHVGFEYEQEDINEGGSSLSWYKHKIGSGSDIDGVFRGEELGCSFQVKYLDKEDIESFGFKHIGSLWFEDEYKNRIRKWGKSVDIYKYIQLEHDLIFRGLIKNKSELSNLLNKVLQV